MWFIAVVALLLVPIYFSQASDKSSAVRLNCPGIGWWASRMMEPDRLGVTIPNHRNHRFILLPPPIPFPSLPPPSIFFSRPRDNHVASVDPGKRVGRRDCARSRFEAHLWTNLPVVLRPGRNTCSCKMHSQHAGRVDRVQWFKIMTIILDEKKFQERFKLH